MKAKLGLGGRWEHSPARWYEQSLEYCDACGLLIPSKQFVVENNGVKCRFCGPDCAELARRIKNSKIQK